MFGRFFIIYYFCKSLEDILFLKDRAKNLIVLKNLC